MADEGGVWRTIQGRKVFIKDDQSVSEAMRQSGKFRQQSKKGKPENGIESVKKIRENLKKLDTDKYETGTYNIDTMEKIDLDSGYQVSFERTGVNLTDEQYNKCVGEFRKLSSDGKAYAGKFGGTPEVSFNMKDMKTALRLAAKYNQVSIWDWKNMREIKNKKYREGTDNDI